MKDLELRSDFYTMMETGERNLYKTLSPFQVQVESIGGADIKEK